MNVTELMSALVLQLGIIIFAVRLGGLLVKPAMLFCLCCNRTAFPCIEEGIDFESMGGKPFQIFIMVISPRKTSGLHIQFLAAIAAALNNDELRQKALEADTRPQLISLLRKGKM
jgi:hypothetical protein